MTFFELTEKEVFAVLSWCPGQWIILHLTGDLPFCPCKYFNWLPLLDVNSCSFSAGTLYNGSSCLCMVSLQGGDTSWVLVGMWVLAIFPSWVRNQMIQVMMSWKETGQKSGTSFTSYLYSFNLARSSPDIAVRGSSWGVTFNLAS